jgi:hypothetical protein
MSITLLLVLVALVLAIVVLARAGGRSLTGWAILALSIAMAIGHWSL